MRACADDIGGAFGSISGLLKMFPVFALAERIAGLSLKPSKCVIIPLHAPFSLHVASLIKEWLQTNLLEWSGFQVTRAARYLGFVLGPASSQLQCSVAFEKWTNRSNLIAAVGAAASISARLYNVRAVSTLSYIAQLRPLPGSTEAIERRVPGKILRVPGNVFGQQELLNLPVVNGPSFISASCLAAAAGARTATKTVTTWPRLLEELVLTAEEFLPFRSVLLGNLSQPFWDEMPVVSFLHAASSLASFVPPSVLPSSHASTCTIPTRIPPRPLRLPPIRFPFSTPSLSPPVCQGDAYLTISRSWFPPRWIWFLRKRLRGPFRLAPEIVLGIDFDNVFSVLRKYPHHICMTWTKTVCNGWATSTRLHSSEVRPCIFCNAPNCDSLLHYLTCPSFASLLYSTSLPPQPDDLCYLLALSPCSFPTLKSVFVKFTVYHAVKSEYCTHMRLLPEHWRAVCANYVATASAKFDSLCHSVRPDEIAVADAISPVQGPEPDTWEEFFADLY